MLLLLSTFALFAAIAAECKSDEFHVCINVYNSCSFTVWPGIQGSTIPYQKAAASDCILEKADNSAYQMVGLVGKFGPELDAMKISTVKPDSAETANNVKVVEDNRLSLWQRLHYYMEEEKRRDYYDVSLADGYNLPILIMPLDGTYRTNGGEYDCKMCGNCHKDVNELCPNALKVVKHGRTVACKSACLGFNTDEDCCRGPYDSAEHCPNSTYAQIAKKRCPTAFTHAYDYKTSTCYCRGNTGKSAAYNVQFC